MEKVIILKGPSQTGKTSTLLLMIQELKDKYQSHEIVQQDFEFSTTDKFVILKVPNLGNVGIITFGDPGRENDVQKVLQWCLEHDCMAVVGASRTRIYKNPPSVYKILRDFGHKHKAKVVETTPLRFHNNVGQHLQQDNVNTICANNIISILFNL
ncbi:MAG: hypothetical protein HUJ74_00870 [Lachnospiraceae bacterium]|nr:hypothetical protein [Lachnospiraceae bacterium]